MLFDPSRSRTLSAQTHHMNVDYSMYEGREVQGAVQTVVSRGRRVVIDSGRYIGPDGHGQYLVRGVSGRP